jgi:ribonuclease HI
VKGLVNIMKVEVYSDGSSDGKTGGKGGYAWVEADELSFKKDLVLRIRQQTTLWR